MLNEHPAARRLVRALAFALAALALLAGLAAPARAETAAEKYERLRQELEEQNQQLAAIQKDLKNAKNTRSALQQQQTILKEQIATIVAAINEATMAIQEKQAEVDAQQAAIDQRWDEFQMQMQAMQVMHDGGAVAMLSSAQSLYELLTFSDTLQQVSVKQNQVLEDMQAAKAELEARKAELEEQKANLESAQAELEAKKGQLATNITQLDSTISQAEANEQAQQQVVDATEAAYQQAEKEYEEWIRQNSSSGSGHISDSGWMWPLPGQSRITTYFGGNNGFYSGHGGIDVAAPKGTPIVAALSGIAYTQSLHWTYGNMVMIDSGDGVVTIYAHMDSHAVSNGQAVVQGQTIGYVGDTGRSSGYHLHFEVRVNNVKQNPLNYVSAG